MAFMRICSGKFERGMEALPRAGAARRCKPVAAGSSMMADDREIVSEAYAGDIIGVFDPGIFSIGDTITAPGKKLCSLRASRRSRRSTSPA